MALGTFCGGFWRKDSPAAHRDEPIREVGGGGMVHVQSCDSASPAHEGKFLSWATWAGGRRSGTMQGLYRRKEDGVGESSVLGNPRLWRGRGRGANHIPW